MIFPPVPVADGDASLWYSVQVNLRIGFLPRPENLWVPHWPRRLV